ncbi:MAG: glycogen synthase GlgA [Firmicutes bacterium]|nr:glycogen synthase GlgA [Bacillota bacterium]
MAKKQILFAAFEAAPFMKTGGLGDVAGSLPEAVKSPEYDIRVILPLLSVIPDEYKARMKFVKNYEVPLGWRSKYCGLFRMRKGGVTNYFLDNEYYFKRDRIYGEFDDAERIAFFSKAVLETIVNVNALNPDIIHCNDWHTALVPVFLHEQYRDVPGFAGIKTVFTIHNLQFQGQYDKFITGDILGLEGTPAAGQMIHDDAVNFMQGAVIYSDLVTTVSPTYADNICTIEYGEGLEGLFQSRSYKLRGIVNGIDYKVYNPEKDHAVAENYTADTIERKVKSKLALQRELGLPENPDILLFAMVTRMTSQKGMDLVSAVLPQIADRGMQLAILGTGDTEYEEDAKLAAGMYPDKICARIMFDEKLSRRFYAGADCFIMPSIFEPCGLAQMMAMRYGTLPLVRKTGGLKDTVRGYWDYGEEADGFSFNDPDANGLLVTIDQALSIWYDSPEIWKKLQMNAMAEDFSWTKSAEIYKAMYDELAEGKA